MPSPPDDLARLSATELAAGYAAHTYSPVEVLEATLARIARLDPKVNAYRLVDAEGARKAARASEARWMSGSPLGAADGVTLGVKDNIHVAGLPSRFGSQLTPDAPEAADAPAVARLREQGAVVLGKTNMPEYGWKATSDSPLSGITRNPWNTAMTSGGSSAGAAAATVLGMGALHLGTDGGGSVRIPASFCGCFGIKPTRARVPAFPTSPLGTVAHHGPLTRTVADAALAMSAIAAPDRRDVYGWIAPGMDYAADLGGGVKGLKIAFSPTLGIANRVDPEIAAAVEAAVRVLESEGAQVVQADPPVGADPVEAWNAIWWTGMATQMAPFWEKADALGDPGIVAGSRAGAKLMASDLIAAQLERARLHNVFAEFHTRFDLLVTPTLPTPAFEAGELVPPSGGWGSRWTDWAPFSYIFNLTQQPGASIPCGFTRSGLPIGLQIVGPIGADALVLRASRAYERVCPLPTLAEPRGN